MAGRLPGVCVLQKKHYNYYSRYNYNQHHNYSDTYNYSYLSDHHSLDETTLKARQRLQNKLSHFFSSNSRLNENARKEGKAGIEKQVGIGIGRKLLESSWILGGGKNKLKKKKKNKERKVCAVCLEGLNNNKEEEEKQKVMKLSCSHKYHSACLLPWLVSHPHCPYCRTPVR